MAIMFYIAKSEAEERMLPRKRQRTDESNSSRDSNGTQEENPEFKLFDIDLISTATNNFASDNKIGEGGFGPVFKGELPSGQLVAVKRLSRNSQQGLEEFGNEASLIARLQHRNLVKLFGGCVHEDERMLVYEYLPNESLNKFIFDEARKRLLPWAKRFNIIIDVAKGLVYLHNDSRLRVVHRDLKASNILLDSEMMPKISDFGLAKILEGENMLEEPSVRVNGTHGYMAPEYVLHNQISTKLDVFSFGVLVLETISGVRNWGFLHPDHDLNLLGHVWKLWRDGRALEVVDPVLEDDSISETEILRCIQVGLLCAQHRYEVCDEEG
ncbi:G-type lectin S-receptor-like serine/threonine-protein kinase At4g27290 [Camellia sinensis]|uniref:G-type lectin S-receptor-like serine/threonine-protein kinase At4g27290 n=1 Tax=Camellia sinensis TaxID=4442 RepID=UPI001036CFD4|nr:G-type lectin S-receptor-like serine/threonine-protein kinase At4g27290 [Camellia sinensis]